MYISHIHVWLCNTSPLIWTGTEFQLAWDEQIEDLPDDRHISGTGSPSSAVANVLDYDFIEIEFELLPRYYVFFFSY